MGEIADGLIDGDFDYITGEYIGRGMGVPRTRTLSRKSEDLSWKRVTGYMNTMGIKAHLHPQILKDYGCTYSGRHPLRNACFEVLKDFEKFKKWLLTFKSE
jgi:hypothetical protein